MLVVSQEAGVKSRGENRRSFISLWPEFSKFGSELIFLHFQDANKSHTFVMTGANPSFLYSKFIKLHFVLPLRQESML